MHTPIDGETVILSIDHRKVSRVAAYVVGGYSPQLSATHPTHALAVGWVDGTPMAFAITPLTEDGEASSLWKDAHKNNFLHVEGYAKLDFLGLLGAPASQILKMLNVTPEDLHHLSLPMKNVKPALR